MRAALLPLCAALAFGMGACGAPPKPAAVALATFANLGPPSSDVMDAILPDAEAAAMLDASALRDLPVTRAVLILTKTKVPVDMFPQLLGAMGTVNRQFDACGFSPLTSLERFAASEKGGKGVLAAKFDVPPAKVLKCVQHFFPTSEKAQLADMEALRLVTGHYAVARGELVWIGDKESLVRAFSPHPKAPLVAKLRPSPDTLAALWAEPPNVAGSPKINAHADIGDKGFLIEIDANLPTEAIARQAAAELLAARGRVTAQTKGLMESLEVKAEASGTRLHVLIDAKGGQEVVTAGIAALAASAAIEVRRVQDGLKVLKARETLKTIGKAMEASYAKSPENKRRFPASGHAVPKDIPKGTRAMLADSDWQIPGWKDSGFTLAEPSFYQYEFITSPDGKTVTLRARGDLDGNGKASLLELKLTAKGDSVTTGALTAKDELE